MPNQDLVNYIKSELARGISMDQVRQAVLAAGWPEAAATEAINSINAPGANIANAPVNTPVNASAANPISANGPISIPAGNPISINEPAISIKSEVNAVQEIKVAKKLPKIWLIAGIVAILGLAAGVTTYFIMKNPASKTTVEESPIVENSAAAPEVSAPAVPIECATDTACFISASNECKPANAVYSSTSTTSGIIVSDTKSLAIQEMENKKCSLQMIIQDEKLSIAPEASKKMTKAQIATKTAALEKQAQSDKGLKGICSFVNNSDLSALLAKITAGTAAGGVTCKLSTNAATSTATGTTTGTATSTGTGSAGTMQCVGSGDWATAECAGKLFERTIK